MARVRPQRAVWLGAVLVLTVTAASLQVIAVLSRSWLYLGCQLLLEGDTKKVHWITLSMWNERNCTTDTRDMYSNCMTMQAALDLPYKPGWLHMCLIAHLGGAAACFLVAILVAFTFTVTWRLTRRAALGMAAATATAGAFLVVGQMAVHAGYMSIRDLLRAEAEECEHVEMKMGAALVMTFVALASTVLGAALALAGGYTTDLAPDNTKQNKPMPKGKFRKPEPQGLPPLDGMDAKEIDC